MRQLYSIGIGLYYIFLWISSFFNRKAKNWFYGRHELFTKLEDVFLEHNSSENPAPVIWFHCASLGEYEQGRPVIQQIKNQYPGFKVILTFFSPSGYNHRSTNSEADFVFYLPLDTRRNARRFIKIVSPTIAVFVKYEFWFNYLNELYINKIPIFTVSAIFRPDQHFFKWYGGWFRTHLRRINKIFVQDEGSKELLQMIDVNNSVVSGDTRFDRVIGITETVADLPVIEKFLGNQRCIVAGSTWPADEDLLVDLYNNTSGSLKMIIAPHEVTSQHVKDLLEKFESKAILYSEAQKVDPSNYSILIIDTIGILSKVYRYGTIAYIGGGFGVGIHNTLEAAVYGMPVLFGPNYQRFKEARELITQNAAISIENIVELNKAVTSFLNSPEKLKTYSDNATNYVRNNAGATESIMRELEGYIRNVLIY